LATLEIEGAERGWLASVGLDRDGRPAIRACQPAEISAPLASLLQRLLEEPLEGTLLGARRGEDLLYGLATVFGRRRPLLGAERVFAYVAGGSRAEPAGPRPPGWDEA
jgi:hypothetical protein